MPDRPRAMTAEECREAFLQHMIDLANYWGREADTPEKAAEGMLFSVLSALDGSTLAVPSLDLVASPHPEDEDYSRSQGANWWPAGLVINDCQLHEMFHPMIRKAKGEPDV